MKYLKLSLLFVFLVALALPVNPASAAVDQKQEAIHYFDALSKIAKYETKALDAYYKNNVVTSSNRKATYITFNNTVVPNYQKFVSGLKAVKAPVTPELLKLHKAGINAAAQQLNALTIMKNALYKNPMDSAAWDKANKILKTAAPLMDKWGEDLVAYYTKVVTAEESKGTTPSKKNQYIELPLKITEDKAAQTLRESALAFLQSYARALKSGDTAEMDALLNKLIAPEVKYELGMGPKYSVDKMDDRVSETIANNDADILDEWADAILASTAADFEVKHTYKSNITLSVTYSMKLADFDAFSTPYVYFNLVERGGVYIIDSLRVD